MLKDILTQRNISVYKLSKETDISYSTLNDIVIEKTDIKNASASVLYRLSKYLDISMERLYENSYEGSTVIYLYNDGRNVILEFEGNRIQYLGPKNLLCFNRIRRIEMNVVYVECCFEDEEKKIYREEDYIDLSDVLSEYTDVLNRAYSVRVGKPKESLKNSLIDQAFLVSDSIAVLLYDNTDIPDSCVQVVSLARPSQRAVIRLRDYSVVTTNMSSAMLTRAIASVRRNIEEINEVIAEVARYA